MSCPCGDSKPVWGDPGIESWQRQIDLPRNGQTGSGAHANILPLLKWPGRVGDHLSLVPRLKMSGVMPPHPLHAFIVWTVTDFYFVPLKKKTQNTVNYV